MRKWTIIIQISGENNLLLESISAFNEFGVKGSNKDVAFVLLMDAMQVQGKLPASLKFLNNKKFSVPAVYLASKGMNFKTAKPKKRFPDRDNLVASKNLSFVLRYIKKTFKAEHYGYIYKGHGSKGQGDIGNGEFFSKVVEIESDEYDENGNVDAKKVEVRIEDELLVGDEGNDWTLDEVFLINDNVKFPEILLAIFKRNNTKALTYLGLSRILQKVFTKKELSFVLLDCCWGMMIENVDIFRKATKFLIASPDEMPALGIGYERLCSLILKRATIRPEELAKMLVAVYYSERYSDYEDPEDLQNKEFFNMGVSLTCANTDFFANKILSNFNRFCDTLRSNMRQFVRVLISAVSSCRDYTYANPLVYEMFNIDLIWFVENFIYQNNKVTNRNAVNDTVNDLALLLLRDLKIYLIEAYLCNNYKKTGLGVSAIGGKGISITFPKKVENYDLALISERFYSLKKWKLMIKKFHSAMPRIERIILQPGVPPPPSPPQRNLDEIFRITPAWKRK